MLRGASVGGHRDLPAAQDHQGLCGLLLGAGGGSGGKNELGAGLWGWVAQGWVLAPVGVHTCGEGVGSLGECGGGGRRCWGGLEGGGVAVHFLSFFEHSEDLSLELAFVELPAGSNQLSLQWGQGGSFGGAARTRNMGQSSVAILSPVPPSSFLSLSFSLAGGSC